MDDAMEKALSDYLDSEACDKAEDAWFSILRAVFRAGWEAGVKHAGESS